MRWFCKSFALCLWVSLLFVMPLMAQNSGSIQGTVVDPQGAVISGASVQAIDQTKGIVVRETTTGADGLFLLQPLQPGTYTIRVTAQGMRAMVRKDLNLDSRQSMGLGVLNMTVGAASETVNVESVTPLVETATSDHSSVIDARQVADTSLNGRDFQSLISTLPGVVTNQGDSSFRMAFNNTDQFNVNGLRGSMNNVFLDGAINTDVGANDGQFTQLSMDAVGEFKVQSGNFSAEYGRNPGVLLAINTKSGGRQYHGTLYEFNREDGFDAKPYHGTPSKLRFNQYGGNLGGPIPAGRFSQKSDPKMFFFFNYEGTRGMRPDGGQFASSTVNNVSGYRLPDPAQLNGDFTSSYRNRPMCANVGEGGIVRVNGSGCPVDVQGQVDQGPIGFRVGQVFYPNTIKYNTAGQIYAGTPIGGTVANPTNIIPAFLMGAQAGAWRNLIAATNAYRAGWFHLTGEDADKVFVPFRDTYTIKKHQEVLRYDWHINAKTNFFFRWVDDAQWENRQSGLFGYQDYPIMPQFRKKPGSSWAWNLVNVVSPTVTNEFTFTYNHLTQVVDLDAESSKYDKTKLGFTYKELYPAANLHNRFPSLNCCDGSFSGAVFPAGWLSEARMFTWTDNVTKVAGKHTIKTGVFWEYNQAGQQPAWTDSVQFNFQPSSTMPMDTNNTVANMLLGNYQTASQSDKVAFGAFRFTQLELFLQDNIKVNRKLTLDLGLRWAYLGPTKTVQPFFQYYFDPARYNPSKAVSIYTGPTTATMINGQIIAGSGDPYNGMVQEGHDGIPSGFAKHRFNNFGPRIGFAFDPKGNGKMSIRGGAGVFFERVRQNLNSFDALGNPPLTNTPQLRNGNMNDANFGPGLASAAIFPPGQINAFDSEGNIPTIYSWSLGVQRELPWQMGLDVSYVGNTARHVQYAYNLNILSVGAMLNPPGVTTSVLPYKGYSAIAYTKYGANSSYNSLQTKVNRRFGKGLFLSADYTWSKAIDMYDGDNVGYGWTPIADPFHPERNYAVAGFDRKHVFNVSYVYSFPEFSNLGALHHLFGGWQVSGVTRFWTGMPLDVTINGNPGNLNNGGGGASIVRPVYTTNYGYIQNKLTNEWFDPHVFMRPPDGTVGTLGRNALRGAGINNWDMSVFKNFSLTERVKLQLRLETFNTFNHSQPIVGPAGQGNIGQSIVLSADNPNTLANRNSAGQIGGYRDPRQVQLGIKLKF